MDGVFLKSLRRDYHGISEPPAIDRGALALSSHMLRHQRLDHVGWHNPNDHYAACS